MNTLLPPVRQPGLSCPDEGHSSPHQTPEEFALFSPDLADSQEAIEVAEKIAARTGRTVIVQNADWGPIATVLAATKN
ncbi:hypothetical protein [Bradyrhizobium sp. McL0616]|uniref:hypothetical protein n=1 Tax=Bradyrhizobium sp. McL0616 TaxID=3415674 RepID=UPI003CFB9873